MGVGFIRSRLENTYSIPVKYLENEMRNLLVVAVAGLFLTLQGCGASKLPSYAKYDFNAGRYVVSIEDTEGNVSLQFHSFGEAKKVIDEKYDLTWGNGNKLLIENGKLQVNGKALGDLEPGAKIDIKKGPTVFVNGEKR